MTTIHRRQLQQYTQDNYKNTHKTTTTIHTRQLTTIHIRQLTTIHTRQLTTIHTRQLQQHTKDNYNNNTHKTTTTTIHTRQVTTIHTRQVTTIHTRHLKLKHVLSKLTANNVVACDYKLPFGIR